MTRRQPLRQMYFKGISIASFLYCVFIAAVILASKAFVDDVVYLLNWRTILLPFHSCPLFSHYLYRHLLCIDQINIRIKMNTTFERTSGHEREIIVELNFDEGTGLIVGLFDSFTFFKH